MTLIPGPTHREKCQATSRRRMAGKPPTPLQATVLEAIRGNPGQRLRDYTVACFRHNTSFYRKKTEAALKGLLSRSLVELYSSCSECGKELTQIGVFYQCEPCVLVYSAVHIKKDRIRPL